MSSALATVATGALCSPEGAQPAPASRTKRKASPCWSGGRLRQISTHSAPSVGAWASPSKSWLISVTSTQSARGRAWAYSCAPPITQAVWRASQSARACSRLAARRAPSACQSFWRGTTMLLRPGSGRKPAGSESQVLRPMITLQPGVSCLKCARSCGRCQGRRPSLPMTPLAARAEIRCRGMPRSDRHWRLDRGVASVVQPLEIFVAVVEDAVGPAPDAQLRVGVGAARQLGLHLRVVVVVDMAVATGPDELTHVQLALLGHHMGQQRVAGDVEGQAQEDVGAALVELATERD